MATRVLGPGSLTIVLGSSPEKDLSADIVSAALEPSTDIDDPINFLDGTSEAGAQTDSWNLTGTIKEDFTLQGVQAWALTNSGVSGTFEFVPNEAGNVKYTGSVTIAPIKVGGDVKSKNSNDFSFAATDVQAEANG
jgi:hypothetical protein